MDFETVIGLEIHAQLKTESKIFCGCSTRFGEPPNTQTCPTCLGLPGTLPVLNRRVVDFAIRVGLATNAEIKAVSQFARKNYFYPDLPKGYQTSQFDKPIIERGSVEIEVEGEKKTVGITRIHMEEDAGKLIHDEREPYSYVDLNRTGTPLLEIVSEPDMRSPEEAVAYLKKIHAILRYLDVCDGNMQEGSFRCDANISLRPRGERAFGTRTELKNMNSFRNVQAALEFEVRRQRDILLEGDKVIQETLLWNPDTGRTEPMRGKEDAHDYRYFPCPDLVPVVIAPEWVQAVRQSMPELPDERRTRFMTQFTLNEVDASLLIEDKDLADYYEKTVARCGNAKRAANWIMTELLRELKGGSVASCKVTADQLGDLLLLIESGTISGKIAKSVFTEMMARGGDAKQIVTEQNLVQVSDEDELLTVIRTILQEHTGQVEEYRGGKQKVFGFFVGQVMRQTKGKANPQLVNEILARELSG
ncbi:Asp-tRNA(Asn)/Glu-tRNA(Gln) amidotransferase subunit GatB [Desulfofustis limnaeus]|jgi:aspartyl-tRNA(Asn)/glutamyl-tRNA(Gln) amidotransferase subunit B|nr:Asp-tRNA(Asn)/Glu-tRNA(Gln) amidotransferase subunit GatB [Desulfofustis limnaeus]MDX9895206.1 Asp-tRNA(Asn)/Glu-tRNA(Gln) amidotransferase subunit GatB [Desulfofustis sp.]